MGWKMDLTDQTPESVEREGKLESDWYVMAIDDAYLDAKSSEQVFEFTIKRGIVTKNRYAGDKHFERLKNPDLVVEQAQNVNRKKNYCWASRLGVIPAAAYGQEAEVEWEQAIGKEVVLKIKRREWDKDGKSGVKSECEFDIFPPDHEKIPADVRTALGLPPSRKAAAGSETAPPATSPIFGDAGPTAAHVPPGANGAASAGVGAAAAAPAFDVSDL